MSASIDVPVLHGDLVRLTPLSAAHAGDLARAAAADRDAFRFTLVPPPRPDDVEAYIAEQLGRPGVTPFAQIRVADGAAVGCTSYCRPRTLPDGRTYAVEIGWTWLGAEARGTGINTEAKLLLFGHAFTALGTARVDLETDARNDRSRRAVEALGARFEGVLRRSAPSRVPGEEGRLRDSALYSVVDEEWPHVETRLRAAVAGRFAALPWRLERLRADHAPALLRFETDNRAYFAAHIPDRGDDYFASFAEHHARLLAYQAEGTDHLHVIVEPDGEIAGRVNLVESRDGEAELGFRIAENRTGRGLATDAVAAVCERARGYGLTALRARATEANTGSRAVLGKAGFVPTGKTELNGRPAITFAKRLA